ncbi:hypothetical protein D9756_005983 [Leucocoprinus leucothites]|uniref:Uncharacterized protein n=1 Tax=Leucocoprinus leucothites TaxID=201217 RepID=A0A8H5D464_9AGAR|nr:hypothetical protein D9756_005983 [Leucoagaricus leucothites]
MGFHSPHCPFVWIPQTYLPVFTIFPHNSLVIRSMVPSLQQRFKKAESTFLDALEMGDDAMSAFEQEWASLRDDFEIAFAHGSLDPETVSSAYIVSYRISEISQSFLKLEATCQELTASFMDDLDAITQRYSESSESTPKPASSRRDITLAAKWMSKNFYNPYPSSSARDDISRRADWNRKDVDAWFTEARKRIGWNDIRKRFFGNKRAETVENATRFFLGPQVSVDPSLAQAFVNMEMRVREYYIDSFKSDGLATSSSFAPDGTAVDARKGTRINRSSPPPFPVSLSTSPTPITRKRRRTDSIPEGTLSTVSPCHWRQENVSNSVTEHKQLPSPATSQTDLVTLSITEAENRSSHADSRQSPSPTLSPNRKRRRMSHSEAQGRPKLLSMGPRLSRLQTVSSPVLSSARAERRSPPKSPIGPPNAMSPSCPYSSVFPPSPISEASASSESSIPNGPLAQKLLSQPQIPSFSFDIPDPATCHQSEVPHDIDLSLFTSINTFDPQLPSCLTNVTSFPGSSMLENTLETLTDFDNVDINSLSSIFTGSFSDEQLLGLLPSGPYSASSFGMAQDNHVHYSDGTDITSLLNFDAGVLADLPMDDHSAANVLEGITIPQNFTNDVERAKQLAHLDALKKQQNWLQEHILTLESQIDGSVSA